MKVHTIGIIMNGVTGRMGTNQHLIRSILAIRHQGGVKVNDEEAIMPEPILVGRNPKKLKQLAEDHQLNKFSTNLDECLSNPDYQIYFDSQSTSLRVPSILKAIRAGKAVYCEKPAAETLQDAITLYQEAEKAGVKNGVVQDKLWLPGILKLKKLIDERFFGKILAVRGEFGYWVFTGRDPDQSPQRPSWNYKKEEGGGIVLDMHCHWQYVINHLFGSITSVLTHAVNHIKERVDEEGNFYSATADDSSYAIFQVEPGIVCQFNSSWCTRVRRDDLLTIQVDGLKGSALCGLRKCWIQPHENTPRPVWNPDIESPFNYFDDWQEFQPDGHYENAFKAQWELFLRHVVLDEPFKWSLREGAKGVQLAEKSLESHEKRFWIDLEPLPS